MSDRCNPHKKFKTEFGTTLDIELSGGTPTNLEEHHQTKRKIAKQTTAASLLDLNEDCLIEIFERCDIMDLPSIGNSCKYLNDIVHQLFKRKYQILKLNFNNNVSVQACTRARRLILTFGFMIIDLELNFNPYESHDDHYSVAVVEGVITFCKALQTFKLTSFDIPDNLNFFNRMGQLFGQLEKLHLRHVFISECYDYDHNVAIITPNGNFINLFANCKQLIQLKLEESYFFYQSVFANSFPQLEHFIIEDPVTCRSSLMDEFILRHPKLKTFSLDCEYLHIPVVAANCESLETFGFQFDFRYPPHPSETSVESLAKFRHLKKLICFAVGREHNMRSLLKVLPKLANSLEVLELAHGCVTREFIKVLSSMKKLKVVRLECFEIIKDVTRDDLKNSLNAKVIIGQVILSFVTLPKIIL